MVNQVAPNPDDLRRVAKIAIDDVVADAIRLLALYHRFQQTEPDSDAEGDLRSDLETQITTLRVHAESAETIFEDILDSLPEDSA